jgi:Uma2 family endonuclease
MSTATRLITADELLRMPDEHPRCCELVDGEIVQMSPPGFAHAIVSQTLSQTLWEYVSKRGLGRVISTEVGFIVSRDPDTVLAPDGAFIREDRFRVIGIPIGYFPEVPTLIFEVISPNDKPRDIFAKMQRWLAGGVELAWSIDPRQRTVTVWRPGEEPSMLKESDTLIGEPVLPEFKCGVADIFAAL